MTKRPIEIIMMKPYTDIRYGARIHILTRKNVKLLDEDKSKVINTLTGEKYDRPSYYDSLTNSNGQYNKHVNFSFKITGSKIFREILKSIPQVNVIQGEEFDELSEEFNLETIESNDYNLSCEFYLNVNLYYLIKLLSLLEDKLNLFYQYYGIRIIDEIDRIIESQIRSSNIFTKIYSSAKLISNYDEFINVNYDKAPILEIRSIDELNRFEGFRFVSLISNFYNITSYTEMHSDLRCKVGLVESVTNGFKSELRKMLCNVSNLSEELKELVKSNISPMSSNLLTELVYHLPCGGDCKKCNMIGSQINKIIEKEELPCGILLSDKSLFDESDLGNSMKELVKENENNQYKLMYYKGIKK